MGNQCRYLINEEIDSETLDISKKRSLRDNKVNKLIEELRKQIKELPIFERDKIAEDKYNNYIKNKSNNSINLDFFEEYIKIIELVLLDETNKKIVLLYLNFIIENEVSIKKEGLKTFFEEINKYVSIFTIDEMKKIEKEYKTKSGKNIFFGLKIKSEKQKFIEFLEKLKDINELNYDIIYNIAEKENIKYSIFLFHFLIKSFFIINYIFY